MRCNTLKRDRKSYRLKGYDYSQEGLYFVTICTHERNCLFGQVNVYDGELLLCELGTWAFECWTQIPIHFPNVVLHEFVIMPNHIHGILEIVKADDPSFVETENRTNIDSSLRSPSKTIGSVVRGFKIGVTKWARLHTEHDVVWQRNYFDHIIRDETAYEKISDYILQNPLKWAEDKFYCSGEKI